MNAPTSTPPKIAVIGPSQSGKTCLAVGLYATSLHGFTIQPRDGSATTYLADRKVEITKRKWPGANLVGKKESIRLDFVKKGHAPVLLDIPEYGGEILRDDNTFKSFANEYLRDLDGVLILLNPGAAAFQSEDATLREDYMIQYRRAVSFLADKNNKSNGSDKAFVALVVTAADRIAPGGDLRQKRAVFDECAKEIENLVHSSSFPHKWFHVTITGRLETQDNPVLAKGWRNSASKPFLWLLWKIKWGPIRAAILKRLLFVGLVAAALAASYGGYRYMEWKRENKEILDRVQQLERILQENDAMVRPDDAALDAARLALQSIDRPVAFRFRPLLAATVIPNDAALNQAKEVLLPLYSNSRQLAQENVQEMERRVWTLFKRRIERDIEDIKIDAAKNATVEAVLQVDGLFAKFVPRYDPPKSEHEALRATWDTEKKQFQEQHIIQTMIDNISKPLDALAGRHGDDAVTMLFTLYGELAKVNPPEDYADLVAKRNELAARLDKRTADEFRWFNKYADLSPDQVTAKSNALLELVSTWTPATESGIETKPVLVNEIGREADKFISGWNSEQKKICTDWVGRHVNKNRKRVGSSLMSGGSLWNDYEAFAKEHQNNPYFESVVQRAVYEQVESWFEGDVNYFRNVLFQNLLWKDKQNLPSAMQELESRFDGLKNLCAAVAGDKTPRRTSWAFHFAQSCMEQGHVKDGIFKAFPQLLVVEKIEGEISYYDSKKKKKRYPTNYRRTAFGARVEVVQRHTTGDVLANTITGLLPFEKNGKDAKYAAGNSCDEKNESKTFFDKPVRIVIHPFEENRLVFAVTDWIAWSGVKMKPTSNSDRRFIGKFNESDRLDSLKGLDLSFDLHHSDGVAKPKLTLSIVARVEGDGIGDYFERAKEAAAKAALGDGKSK